MGQFVFVQKKIGVLLGVSFEEQLKNYADYIIFSILNICDFIFEKGKIINFKL